MDLRDQISVYLNSAWKRGREETPHAGHSLVNFGEWTGENGFVKKDSARYKSTTIPCPVVVIVEEKIGKKDLLLTITGRVAEYNADEEFDQIGVTITKKLYTTGTTIKSTTLTIPRFTTPTAIFLLSGLGNKIYEITSVTPDLIKNGSNLGKVSFHGLASEGSKILYYLGMINLHNTVKQIINSIWISPNVCAFCKGEKLINNKPCPECNGYGYISENASRGIAISKGYDVGISRENFSSYPLTDDQWNIAWEFINKTWTQKWWVTPTISEIKRMFAHFYNVNPTEILIEEIYHSSMPHWNISIPLEGSVGSPFPAGNTDLMKFIVDSITPAGVNVFVGFYANLYLGNLDDLSAEVNTLISSTNILSMKIWESSIEQEHELWRGRWRCWDGWCECVDNFEEDLSKWDTSGLVDIYNANNIGRHWARLQDNSYLQTKSAYNISNPTGVVELWIHPLETNLRIGGYLTGIDQWAFYVDFKNNGFYDHNNNLIRPAKFDNDFHLRIDFVSDKNINGTLGYVDEILINQELFASGIVFLNAMAPNRPIRIQSFGTGLGFVDNFGADWVSGCVAGDNWPRLYPWGWGQSNADNVSGVSGLYENYFRKDRIICII